MTIPARKAESQVPPHGPGLRLAQPGIAGLTWASPHELRYNFNLSKTNLYDMNTHRSDEHWRGLLNDYYKNELISRDFAHSILARVQFRRGLAQYKLSRYRMVGKSSDGLVEVKYSPLGEIIELTIDPRVDKLPSRERYDHILAAISDAAVKGRQITAEENKQLSDDCWRMIYDPLTGDEIDPYYNNQIEPAERIRLLPSQSEVKNDLYHHSKAQDGELEDLEHVNEEESTHSESEPALGQSTFLRIVDQALSESPENPVAQGFSVRDKSKKAAQDTARSIRSQEELFNVLTSLETDIDKQTKSIEKLNERISRAKEKQDQLSRHTILGSVSPKTGSLKQQLWRRAGMTELDMSHLVSMRAEQKLEEAEKVFEQFSEDMEEEMEKSPFDPHTISFNLESLDDAANENENENDKNVENEHDKKMQQILYEMITENGKSVAEISKKQRVFIAFLRTMLCPYNIRVVQDISRLSKSLRKLNIKVVFVHQATKSIAHWVFNKFAKNLDYEIVSDHKRVLYHQFGLEQWKPKDCVSYQLKLAKKFFRLGSSVTSYNEKEQGSVKQMGGFFVVENVKILSEMKQKTVTDSADVAEFSLIEQQVNIVGRQKRVITYRGNNQCIVERVCDKIRNQHPKKQKKEESEKPEKLNNDIFQFKEENNHQNHQNHHISLSSQIRNISSKVKRNSRKFQLFSTHKKQPETDLKKAQELGISVDPSQWNVTTVLENDHLRSFFKVFVTKELSPENLLFYEDYVVNLRNTIKKYSSKIIQEDSQEVINYIKIILDGLETLQQDYLTFHSLRELNVPQEFFNEYDKVLSHFKTIYFNMIDFAESEKENNFSKNDLEQNMKQLISILDSIDETVELNLTDSFSRFKLSSDALKALQTL
eukprot:gb/GECH01008262.1/.p1 GENE.gb/GECH01008262.1/~~gb/GECH01008262.1/.p1  ORF type:complete len:880 (+),score=221.98 gb/GECH01008262.1/:1-2640(+)